MVTKGSTQHVEHRHRRRVEPVVRVRLVDRAARRAPRRLSRATDATTVQMARPSADDPSSSSEKQAQPVRRRPHSAAGSTRGRWIVGGPLTVATRDVGTTVTATWRRPWRRAGPTPRGSAPEARDHRVDGGSEIDHDRLPLTELSGGQCVDGRIRGAERRRPDRGERRPVDEGSTPERTSADRDRTGLCPSSDSRAEVTSSVTVVATVLSAASGARVPTNVPSLSMELVAHTTLTESGMASAASATHTNTTSDRKMRQR